jgi:hypothetical protein
MTPQFALLGLNGCQAVDTNESDSDAGPFGISVMDSARQYCNSVAIEDAAATTNTQSLSDDQAINFPDHTGGSFYAATMTGFVAGEVPLSYSAANAATRQWIYLAVGASAAQSADVPVGLVDFLGLAPGTRKSTAAPIALVDLLGVAPSAEKLAASPAGLIDFVAFAPDTDKVAAVPIALVELVGLPPVSPQSADIDPGLLRFQQPTTEFAQSVTATVNDGHATTGVFDNTSTVASVQVDYRAFVRFPSAPIPPGATILSAVLSVVASSEIDLSGKTVSVFLADEDDSAAMADESDALGRTLTTAFGSGDATGLGFADSPFDFPDAAEAVAEVIARGGWATGNALQLILTIDDSGSAFYTVDDVTHAAPSLTIVYRGPGLSALKTATLAPAVVELLALAPATTKAAGVAVGLIDLVGVPLVEQMTADVPAGLVEIAALAPDTDKVSAVDVGSVDLTGIAPATAKSAALSPGLIEIVGLAPATAKAAPVTTGLIDFIGVELEESSAATVPAGSVDLTGLTPSTAKVTTLDAAALEFTGVEPTAIKSAALSPGLIDFTGLAPTVLKLGNVAVGLVSLVGLTPATAKTAAVDVGVVTFLALTPAFDAAALALATLWVPEARGDRWSPAVRASAWIVDARLDAWPDRTR